MFPGGVHSPVRAFKSVDGPPIFIESGDACMMNDVDGNAYIDFCCSWGPLILGHNHSSVRSAIEKSVKSIFVRLIFVYIKHPYIHLLHLLILEPETVYLFDQNQLLYLQSI